MVPSAHDESFYYRTTLPPSPISVPHWNLSRVARSHPYAAALPAAMSYSSGQSSMPLSSGVCSRSLRLVHIGNDDVAFNPNRSKQERICAQKDAQQWRASEATLAQSPGNETWPFAAVASSNTGILPLPMHHSKHISLLWILKLSHQLVSLGWWRRSTKMS